MQQPSKSFADFQASRADQSADSFQDDLSALIDAHNAGEAVQGERHLILLQEIMQELSKPLSQASSSLNKIYEFADSFIDVMGTRQGYVHTCLRHIAHGQGGGTYAQKMDDKISSVFNAQGILSEEIGQFLEIQRNGHFTLNSWGEEILSRLDERQILAAYHLDPEGDIPQIYTLKELVARERDRLEYSQL